MHENFCEIFIHEICTHETARCVIASNRHGRLRHPLMPMNIRSGFVSGRGGWSWEYSPPPLALSRISLELVDFVVFNIIL